MSRPEKNEKMVEPATSDFGIEWSLLVIQKQLAADSTWEKATILRVESSGKGAGRRGTQSLSLEEKGGEISQKKLFKESGGRWGAAFSEGKGQNLLENTCELGVSAPDDPWEKKKDKGGTESQSCCSKVKRGGASHVRVGTSDL